MAWLSTNSSKHIRGLRITSSGSGIGANVARPAAHLHIIQRINDQDKQDPSHPCQIDAFRAELSPVTAKRGWLETGLDAAIGSGAAMTRLALALCILAAPAFAAGDAPETWPVEEPYPQKVVVIEEAVIGPYVPGLLWSTPIMGYCGSERACGDYWISSGGYRTSNAGDLTVSGGDWIGADYLTSGGGDRLSGGGDWTSGGGDWASGGDNWPSGGDNWAPGGDDWASGGGGWGPGGDDWASGGGAGTGGQDHGATGKAGSAPPAPVPLPVSGGLLMFALCGLLAMKETRARLRKANLRFGLQ